MTRLRLSTNSLATRQESNRLWLQSFIMNCISPILVVYPWKITLFLKQNYSQMVRTRLKDHPSVCGFYTTYAAFLLFKFQQEELTGVHDVTVLSFINNFMYYHSAENTLFHILIHCETIPYPLPKPNALAYLNTLPKLYPILIHCRIYNLA